MTDRNIPLLDLKAQFIGIEKELRAALDSVLDSQRFILGPEVSALEEEVASYVSCSHGIGVSSGSDALLIALMALDLRPGDEVITTPYTFFATVGAIARLGAKAVLVDIDPKTYNIDPNKLSSALTPKTKAVIPVHLFGQSAEMDPILSVCHEKNIPIIEDAAQAIGTEYQGRRVGSFGKMSCFSFFPSKNLGAFGDAGMVTTNDPELAEKLRVLRAHGSKPKYYHKYIGGNFRLDALQAAILRVKLKHLDSWTQKRQENAGHYAKLIQEAGLTSQVSVPWIRPGDRHIFNQYVIRVQRRDELQAHLKSNGIGTEVYYPLPMHLQECFRDLGYKKGDFPESEKAADESLAIPVYPELTESQQRYVMDTLLGYFQ